MRLILREEIDHLGRRGDIVNVKRGFARNFLLPKRLAMEVTDENLRVVEKEKKIYEARLAKEKVEAERLAAQIQGIELSFIRKVHGEGNELYGSVSPTDVAEELEKLGFEFEKRKISLSEPIKALGDYAASVKLHPEVSVTLPVHVERDERDVVPETPQSAPPLPGDDVEEEEQQGGAADAEPSE